MPCYNVHQSKTSAIPLLIVNTANETMRSDYVGLSTAWHATYVCKDVDGQNERGHNVVRTICKKAATSLCFPVHHHLLAESGKWIEPLRGTNTL